MDIYKEFYEWRRHRTVGGHGAIEFIVLCLQLPSMFGLSGVVSGHPWIPNVTQLLCSTRCLRKKRTRYQNENHLERITSFQYHSLCRWRKTQNGRRKESAALRMARNKVWHLLPSGIEEGVNWIVPDLAEGVRRRNVVPQLFQLCEPNRGFQCVESLALKALL